MKFDFIPFRLNADIADLKDQIKYVTTNNGIELFKANWDAKLLIPGIISTDANLYFFEGSLITAYIHLAAKSKDLDVIRELLENHLNRKGKFIETGMGKAFLWENDRENLFLIISKIKSGLYLYFTIKMYTAI